MFNKRHCLISAITILVVLALATGCATPTAEVSTQPQQPAVTVVEVQKTVEVEKIVEKTVIVEPTSVPEKEPIRIGVTMAFSGPIAYTGESAMMGLTLALEELGGNVAGYPIEFSNADNACNPDQAVGAIRKLVDVDNVDLIVGSGCSSCTLASLPLIEEAQVPQVTGGSTNPQITEDSGVGGNIWEFRFNADDRVMAEGFAPYIAQQCSSISTMAYNDDYGRGAVEAYVPLLTEAGTEVVSEEYFERGAADMRPLLLRIKQADPECMLIVATETDGIVILRQLRELGLDQKLFARGAIVTPLFFEMTQDEPGLNEGVLEGTWWAKGMDPAFDEAFVERWGTAPSPHRAMYYYMMRYVLSEAIKKAAESGEINRETLRAALEEVSVDTPIGHIEFDDHHQAHPNMAISTAKGGEVVLVEVIETQ